MMNEILRFWFEDNDREAWFKKEPAFDQEIRDRFRHVYDAAAGGEHMHWKATPRGALALIVLLDQFPRNMFRQSPKAYATDPIARAIARHVLDQRHDRAPGMTEDHCLTFYLPFEHSEDLEDQRLYMRLIVAVTDAEKPNFFARRHKEIIQRFGRFPHRNVILGRTSSAEEIAFLKEPHSSF
jgi:uncharacterized protein (DUF924 family)